MSFSSISSPMPWVSRLLYALDVKGPRPFKATEKGGRAEEDFLAGFERSDGGRTGSTRIGDEGVTISSMGVAEGVYEELRERLVTSCGRGGRGAVGAGKAGAGRAWSISCTPLTVLRLAIFGLMAVVDPTRLSNTSIKFNENEP